MDIKQLKNKLCSSFGVCNMPDEALAFILAEYSKGLPKEPNTSIIEWHKFDKEDATTWPEEQEPVQTNLGYGWLFYPYESEEYYEALEWEVTEDGCVYKTNAPVTYWANCQRVFCLHKVVSNERIKSI